MMMVVLVVMNPQRQKLQSPKEAPSRKKKETGIQDTKKTARKEPRFERKGRKGPARVPGYFDSLGRDKNIQEPKRVPAMGEPLELMEGP